MFLRGEIGSGKTSLLKKLLAPMISNAGGFVTRPAADENGVFGIELLPARDYLNKRPENQSLIISFEKSLSAFNPKPFAAYFSRNEEAPFYLFDEIGGAELLDPHFLEGFRRLLRKGKPLIAVLKSQRSALLLSRRLGLGEEYLKAHAEFTELIESHPESVVVEHYSRGDTLSEKRIKDFIRENLNAQFI